MVPNLSNSDYAKTEVKETIFREAEMLLDRLGQTTG